MIRVASVAVVGTVALSVLVKLWVAPDWGGIEPTPIEWPASPQVAGWEQVGPEPLVGIADERTKAAAGASYSYRRNESVVTVEARSFLESTGDTAEYAAKLKQAEAPGEVRQFGNGWYRVRHAHGQAILETCLDAQGRATVTPEQFAANRRRYDRTIDRLGRWVLGRGPLHDRRVLWLHMAMPSNPVVREEAWGQMQAVLSQWQMQLANSRLP